MKIVNIYCLQFQFTQDSFFHFFCFGIYKMVDRMEIYKSLNISILTVRRNSKMLKFVPEYVEKKKKKKCVSM